MARLTFILTPDLKKKIQAAAKADDRTASDWVRLRLSSILPKLAAKVRRD